MLKSLHAYSFELNLCPKKFLAAYLQPSLKSFLCLSFFCQHSLLWFNFGVRNSDTCIIWYILVHLEHTKQNGISWIWFFHRVLYDDFLIIYSYKRCFLIPNNRHFCALTWVLHLCSTFRLYSMLHIIQSFTDVTHLCIN